MTEMCDFPFPSSYKMDFAGKFTDSRGTDNIRFFSRVAKENNCNVSFSTIAKGKGDYHTNTMYLLNRRGEIIGQYDKYYVTGGENKSGSLYGDKTPVFDMDFGRVSCAICFDLNFDDLRDKYKKLKPEMIIFASQFHGGLLQQIWANECRAFFVGAIAHQIPSSILSPLGEILFYSTNYLNYATGIINMDCAFAHLAEQSKITELKKKYGGGVTLYDPCHIGYFMLTNELDGITINEMFKEFGILSYDDYLAEQRENRLKPGNIGESGKIVL